MDASLVYLVWAALLTGLLWIPVILDRFMTWGLGDTVGYPDSPPPQSAWAIRAQAAHKNATENLVVFAALVLAASALNVSSPTLQTAAAIYLIARIVHYLAYLIKIPWIRTLGFLAGWACQMVIAVEILF